MTIWTGYVGSTLINVYGFEHVEPEAKPNQRKAAPGWLRHRLPQENSLPLIMAITNSLDQVTPGRTISQVHQSMERGVVLVLQLLIKNILRKTAFRNMSYTYLFTVFEDVQGFLETVCVFVPHPSCGCSMHGWFVAHKGHFRLIFRTVLDVHCLCKNLKHTKYSLWNTTSGAHTARTWYHAYQTLLWTVKHIIMETLSLGTLASSVSYPSAPNQNKA